MTRVKADMMIPATLGLKSMSYIAEMFCSTLATGEAGCTLNTYSDLTLAAVPFLLQCFAHREPMLVQH